MHLVLLGVGERLPRVAHRRLRLRPGHQRVAEVAERARRLVLVAGLVREGVSLEQRRDLAVVDVQLDAGDVDERVRARALVAELRRELERALPPDERLVVVLGELLELREAAVGAGELDRLAERLEDLDRLERLRARGVAVAGVPVEPGQDLRAAADRRLVAERRSTRRSRARSRRRRRRAGRRRRPRPPAPRAPPPARAGEPVEECRGAAVVGVRLAVRVERRRPPRGDERVVGDDVLRARGLGVVDDVGRVGVGREQRREDLGVQPPPRRDRDARPDRVARELVPEANVARVDLEQRPALGLLRRRRASRA